MNTGFSTHPKGTNRKRAGFFCLRYFAVVIRHLICRPQRCQNLRQTSQQKFEGMRKPCNGYEGPPFDDQIAVPCRNAIDGEGHFLAFISDLTSAWRMITYQKVFPLCKFHRIREAGIEGEWGFLWLKSLNCRKKSFFRDKIPRIAESNFRITIISTIFTSNI